MISTLLWNRFQWKAVSLVALPPLKDTFLIRSARAEEKDAILDFALFSLKMNTDWHDATGPASLLIQESVKQAFASVDKVGALVITHGQRIIGVSMFDDEPTSRNHLLSGPWVLMEYRNRGFGTILLHATLQTLVDQGVHEIYGITRSNTIASKFVYSKFGGIIVECPLSPFSNSEKEE